MTAGSISTTVMDAGRRLRVASASENPTPSPPISRSTDSRATRASAALTNRRSEAPPLVSMRNTPLLMIS
jgi:hypothetical protein